jgi:hypothetical protein
MNKIRRVDHKYRRLTGLLKTTSRQAQWNYRRAQDVEELGIVESAMIFFGRRVVEGTDPSSANS